MQQLFSVLEMFGVTEGRLVAAQAAISLVGLFLSVREAWLAAPFSQVIASCSETTENELCLTENVASLLSPPVFFWAGVASVLAWRGVMPLAYDLSLALALPALLAGLLWARCGFGGHGNSCIQLSAVMQIQFLLSLCNAAPKFLSPTRKLRSGTSKRSAEAEDASRRRAMREMARARSNSLPRGWRLHQTVEGQVYFEHLRTGRVQSTLPETIRRDSAEAAAPPLRIPELIIERSEKEVSSQLERCSDFSPCESSGSETQPSPAHWQQPESPSRRESDSLRLRTSASAPITPELSSHSTRSGRASVAPGSIDRTKEGPHTRSGLERTPVRRGASADRAFPLRELLSAFEDAEPDEANEPLLGNTARGGRTPPTCRVERHADDAGAFAQRGRGLCV